MFLRLFIPSLVVVAVVAMAAGVSNLMENASYTSSGSDFSQSAG